MTDTGAGHGTWAVVGDDGLSAGGIACSDRLIDGDLHLTGRESCGSGGRVDRAVADQEQASRRARPPSQSRCTISSIATATWTYRQATRS